MAKIDVTELANALADEEATQIEAGTQTIALCRTEYGLFAVSGICTHAYAQLADGFVIDRYIECPLHQAQFDVTTGERVSGPECESLKSFAVIRDGERIFVETD